MVHCLPQKQSLHLHRKAGFTMIEVLVAIAVTLIILAISVQSFRGLEDNEALQRDTSAITSLLETARIHTISSKENTQYGVYISGSDIILFQGDAYISSVEMVTETLHPSVVFDDISLANGSSTVVYERITGDTGNHGTIILRSQDSGATSTIKIDPTGTVTTVF